MKKFIKLFAWGAGALIALLVIAIAAFAFLFDPNALRDDITRLVESKTGRQLTIEGDLSLSFFPWLGFDAGRTTLSNPAGFSSPVMARFETASASVKLLPLISRRVELSQVTLDGVDLQLEIRQDGTSNWSDLEALFGEEDAGQAEAAPGSFATEGVGGVRLTNTRISYSDAESGDRYSIANLDLQTGALVPDKAVTLSASGDIVSEGDQISGPARFEGEMLIDKSGVIRLIEPRFELTARGEGIPGTELALDLRAASLELDEQQTNVAIDMPVMELTGAGPGDPWSTLKAKLSGQSMSLADFERFDLPLLQVTANMSSPDLPGGQVDIKMSGERLQGSLDHQSLAIDGVRAQLLDLSVFSKKVKASSFIDSPVIEAPIEIAEFSPLKLFAKLGYSDIVTADPAALASSTLTANAKYSAESIDLKNLKGTVDQTAVSGSVRLMSSGETRFQITADEVNLDRYRAPSEEPQEAGEAVGVADVEIPADELKLLALDGTLKIGKMQIVGMRAAEVDIGIRAAGGNIGVKPARAQLYGGTYNGDIRLDATGDLPVLSINGQLDSVQFGPLSKDLLDSERLTGAVSGRIAVSGAGHTSNAILASLNGDAVFKFADGAYEGVNLWDRVRRARALIKGQPAPTDPVENRTRFADLTGTAVIKDGVLKSDDIRMGLPFMRVRGAGSLVMLSQELDFRFEGDVLDRPELDASDDDLVGYTIPIKVAGTVSAPSIGVDMGGLLAGAAKRKILDKLGLGDDPDADPDAAATAEGETAEEKDPEEELKDKLKDKLKGLLGGG